jgi:phage virion morphogenesis protein
VIEIKDRSVTLWLNRLAKVGSDFRPMFGEMGAALVESTRLRFRDGREPSGAVWRPLSPVTIALRRKGKGSGDAKPLLDTHRLAGSIAYSAGTRDLVVGTNVVYAKTHQFGAAKGAFGRYSQVGRVRKYGLKSFKGSAGTKQGFPIPWGNIPARPFLGISANDRAEIVAIIRDTIRRAAA